MRFNAVAVTCVELHIVPTHLAQMRFGFFSITKQSAGSEEVVNEVRGAAQCDGLAEGAAAEHLILRVCPVEEPSLQSMVVQKFRNIVPEVVQILTIVPRRLFPEISVRRTPHGGIGDISARLLFRGIDRWNCIRDRMQQRLVPAERSGDRIMRIGEPEVIHHRGTQGCSQLP